MLIGEKLLIERHLETVKVAVFEDIILIIINE